MPSVYTVNNAMTCVKGASLLRIRDALIWCGRVDCRSLKVRLPEILDQHEDAASLVKLRVKNRSAVGGNHNMALQGTLSGNDLPGLAGDEFVEADVAVSHFVGGSEEINPLLPHCPFAPGIHGIENLGFLTSINRGPPDTHRCRPPLHVIE